MSTCVCSTDARVGAGHRRLRMEEARLEMGKRNRPTLPRSKDGRPDDRRRSERRCDQGAESDRIELLAAEQQPAIIARLRLD